MSNEEIKSRPRRGPGPRVAEKPKDFKLALRKMVFYLKNHMPFIIAALILASSP